MKTDQAVREGSTVLLREEAIILNWCYRRLSLIERNLNNWILSTNNSCIKSKQERRLYKEYGVL